MEIFLLRKKKTYHAMILALFFVCSASLPTNFLLGLSPIVPENVFDQSEIKTLLDEEDFFFFKNMDTKTPVWMNSKRMYSRHYLGSRDCYFDLDEVVHRVLTDGFPIQYKLEKLYRSKQGLHASIGTVVPKLYLSFGEGLGGLNIGKLFSGLFNFLHPANWMKIVNQKRVYKISKHMMMLTVFNEVLAAKLSYLRQHQLIQEFEIINFYFIHLQILARKYKEGSRAIHTLMGKFSVDGTDMASQRGRTKLGYDELALLMAFEEHDNDKTLDRFNIKNIKDFPTIVKSPQNLDYVFQNKKRFIEEVVKQSVELKISKELFKISQLNIGIVALGSSFSNLDHPGSGNHDVQFAINLGYSYLPQVLIAKSLKEKSKIDVKNEYIKMINMARRSYDLYTNSLGGYTEAKRSLALNRQAFIINIKHILENKSEPDALFIFSLNHLLKTELKLNNALHGSLMAKAYMERFVLWDKENFLRRIPSRSQITKVFNDLDHSHFIEKNLSILDKKILLLKSSKQLKQLLYHHNSIEELASFEKKDITDAVKNNLGDLLLRKKRFGKRSKFFNLLKKYIDENSISLTIKEHELLQKKANFL